jgi:ABC-type transport system substrate-binding protein
MDEALNYLNAAKNPDERKERLENLQKVYYEELPYLKIGNLKCLRATRSDIENYVAWNHQRFWGVWRSN